MASVKEIDALLPQTQCGECGYAGCLPYAEALAQGAAPINKCPPGGVETVNALGKLLHVDASPYLKEAIDNTRPPQLLLSKRMNALVVLNASRPVLWMQLLVVVN